MINLKSVNSELEKTSGKTGEVVFKGLGQTLKFMGKHPKATVGVIGGGALALAAANKVQSLYNIINEERKRRIMQGQTGILKSILAEHIKGNAPKPIVERHKLKIQPLR